MKPATKIALVSVNRHKAPYPVYPIGISYLASFMRSLESSWNIRVFDMNILEYDECISLLKEFNPDYVGISLRNVDDVNFYNQENFIFTYKKLVEDLRAGINPVVILGGAGFSLYPQKLYDFIAPDYALVGEGEISFHALISALENKSSLEGINGLVSRTDADSVVSERTTPCRHYDFPLKHEPELIGYYWKHSGMMNLQTKRGCPYRCVYCTYPVIEGKNVRTHSIEQIVESLLYLKKDHNINYVFFTDSVFNIENDYNARLAEAIIASEIDMKWGAYFSPSNLDKTLLALLKRSGLTHIEFGTESLSDRVLDAYGKSFSVSDAMAVSALCSELHINFAHFLILAGCGETDNTIDESFANSRLINNTVFFPFVGMRIYPGTTLQKLAVEENIISADDPLMNPVYYVSKDVTLETLKTRAASTGKCWYFPDEDFSPQIAKMRMRNKKGLLWEYLIRN